jgi:anti-sigma factor ChrR (cupin superfamily)
MTDNVQVTPGSGSDPNVATDEVGGVHYQKIKLFDASADSINAAVVTPAGALKTDGSGVTQPVSGSVTAVQASAANLNATVSGTVNAVQSGAWTVTANAGAGTFAISGAVTNAGTFAVQDSQVVADNAAFTDGTTKVFVSGHIFDETAGTALTENDAAVSRINANRAQVMVLEDDATRGRRVTVTAANALKVDNSAVTQPVSGTVTANAGTGTFAVSGAVTNAGTFAVQDSQVVADNAGFTDGTTKVFVSGHIFDETAGTALTENDAAASRINSNRAQVMVIEDDATRGRRVTVTAANALKVDGSAVTQPVSLAGNQAVNLAQVGGNTVSAGNGASGTGVLRVTIASDSTGQIGQVPLTSGGLSISRKLSAASTNATNVKSGAGQVYAVHCMNTNAALRYLKLYDKASAPTVGTDTPVITVPLPTNVPIAIQPACGIAFANGIGFAMTTGIADSDATAVAANEIVLNLLYK